MQPKGHTTVYLTHINTVNIIHREGRKPKISLIVAEPAKN